MDMLKSVKEMLHSGDPALREFFLADTIVLPIGLCLFYALFVKKLGPALMKNRKPFDLRYVMVAYNFTMVAIYLTTVLTIAYLSFAYNLFVYACANIRPLMEIEGSPVYKAAVCAHRLYLFKYLEFLDTVFSVLRKKDHLITNLHVIHHACLPLLAWSMMRTEFTGYQVIPAVINAVIHIIMYSYYGLAALGPRVRQYLWWKKYLTLLQMCQFVLILLFIAVFVPLTGCEAAKFTLVSEFLFVCVIFALFYNFYKKTYVKSNLKIQVNGIDKATNDKNGHMTSNGFICDKTLKKKK